MSSSHPDPDPEPKPEPSKSQTQAQSSTASSTTLHEIKYKPGKSAHSGSEIAGTRKL